MSINDKHTESSKPSFLHSLCCVSGILFLVFIGLFISKTNLHSMMLLCLTWVMLNAYSLDSNMVRLKFGVVVAIQKSASVFIIFLLIGAVIAAFTISGAIPTLLYYGLDFISPQLFLPISMILCSIMSLALGTCWGTIGTLGAALIGLALLFHIPLPVAAGAIVSGAYFGDKFSPISDTTILSALSAETDLYKHIRALVYTMIPPYLISLGLFTIIGGNYVTQSGNYLSDIVTFQKLITNHFYISPITLIPMFVMFALSIRKKPAEISMLASIILALLIAVIFQHVNVNDALNSLYTGPIFKNTGSAILDTLLKHGGIQSMLWPLSLTLLILALGGLIESYHFITVLFETLIRSLKRPFSLVFMTILTSLVCNLLMGEAYLSIILTSKIYKKAFKNMGLDSCVLSNSVEQGSTFSTPLIPWTTSGAFIFTTLGVDPLDYIFWSFFNLIAPCVFLLFVAMNFYNIKIYKNSPDNA
jgi:NhaC family Na+:H+ antiporter